jgi:hypothetical protein
MRHRALEVQEAVQLLLQELDATIAVRLQARNSRLEIRAIPEVVQPPSVSRLSRLQRHDAAQESVQIPAKIAQSTIVVLALIEGSIKPIVGLAFESLHTFDQFAQLVAEVDQFGRRYRWWTVAGCRTITWKILWALDAATVACSFK